MTTTSASFVPMDKFGKDHWSTFAYVETCCVDAPVSDGAGRLHFDRMRCNGETHPLLKGRVAGPLWNPEWGTRLFGYFDAKASKLDVDELGLVLRQHDDWDCLGDLEAVGLLEVISLTQGCVKLTSRGMDVASQLRRHKAQGGQFAQFSCAA